MATTRQMKFEGAVKSSPAAVTMTIGGVEVYNGQVGVGAAIDENIDLITASFSQADNTVPETVAVSITVTSGVINLGFPLTDAAGGGWTNLKDPDNDLRSDIQIDGIAPSWPASPVVPMPGGTPEDPNWKGWFFEVGAGETFTCDVYVYNTADPA